MGRVCECVVVGGAYSDLTCTFVFVGEEERTKDFLDRIHCRSGFGKQILCHEKQFFRKNIYSVSYDFHR